MLGNRHRPVTTTEQQHPDRCGRLPPLPRGRRHPAPAQKGIQQGPGNDKAHAPQHQRWPVLDADADHQVGRPPDHIQRKKGSNQR
ncbi:hypothetical protein D3C76_1468920 [compost metagenome]